MQNTDAKRFLKALAPWVISGGLLCYVLVTQDLAAVYESMRQARIMPFAAWVIVFVVFWLVSEALFLFLCLGWFVSADDPGHGKGPPRTVHDYGFRFFDMVRARAASYLLTMLNFIVGYGGLVVYFRRRFGIPYGRSFAVMLNELLHELASLGILAMAAVALLPAELVPEGAHMQVELASVVGAGALLFYGICFAAARLARFLPSRLRAMENVFTPFSWWGCPFSPVHPGRCSWRRPKRGRSPLKRVCLTKKV